MSTCRRSSSQGLGGRDGSCVRQHQWPDAGLGLWVLGYRRPDGEPFRPDFGDSWLIHLSPDRSKTYLGKAGWFTDVWVSRDGWVYVTDADGIVYRGPEPQGATWSDHRLPGMLAGIWGLDDQHVYAWGEQAGGQATFYGWDGSSWRGLPSPEQSLIGLHGCRSDYLVGVGAKGFIGVFDGAAWRTQ